MQLRACTLQQSGRPNWASLQDAVEVAGWSGEPCTLLCADKVGTVKRRAKTSAKAHLGHDSAVASLAVASSSAMPRCSSTCRRSGRHRARPV